MPTSARRSSMRCDRKHCAMGIQAEGSQLNTLPRCPAIAQDIAFLHAPTRTLIEADLLLNLPPKEQVRTLVPFLESEQLVRALPNPPLTRLTRSTSVRPSAPRSRSCRSTCSPARTSTSASSTTSRARTRSR